MPCLRSILSVFGLCLAVPQPALSSDTRNLDSRLTSLGWEEIIFDGKIPNTYASCGQNCVEITTLDSVSLIGKEVGVNLSRTPILKWEWQIENPVIPSDLTAKGQDDRAAALYVTFPYDPDTATFSEKMLRPIVELARGPDAPGRVISYVWGSFGKTGDVLESPYGGAVSVMVICRNQEAPVDAWVSERFDVVADYQRFFGSIPRIVAHVLLSSDSDDTGATNRARVRNIRFNAD